MRHSSQDESVKNPEYVVVSQQTLDEWTESFDDYKNANKDEYEAYAAQPVEFDAKNFAQQGEDIMRITPEYAGSWE